MKSNCRNQKIGKYYLNTCYFAFELYSVATFFIWSGVNMSTMIKRESPILLWHFFLIKYMNYMDYRSTVKHGKDFWFWFQGKRITLSYAVILKVTGSRSKLTGTLYMSKSTYIRSVPASRSP